MTRQWPTSVGASGVALMAGVALGCGPPGREEWPAGRPRIDRLDYAGQRPRSSLELQFGLDFVDTDGDLGEGILEFAVGDRTAVRLPVQPVFDAQFPPLASTATVGRLELYVELDRPVPTGDRVEIGFLLEDAAGRRSNRPRLTLEAQAAPGGDGE